MRNEIIRTLTTTVVKSVSTKLVDGQVTNEEHVDKLAGEFKEEKLKKAIKALHGDTTLIVSYEKEENTYSISLDDFLAHAKKVEVKIKEEPQQ